MKNDPKSECRPDWITITGKYKTYKVWDVREPEYSADVLAIAHVLIGTVLSVGWYDYGVWKEVKAPPHYKYALQSKEGGIMVAFGSAKQGWMVQLQGVWWARGTDLHALRQSVKTLDLHVSRFDYSLTVQPPTAAASWAQWSGAWAKMQRDQRNDVHPIFAEPYAPTELKTVTAGSRKSPVFIRCYDKRYWVDEEFPAVRLEAEYKKDAAKLAFDAWCENPARSIRDVLRRFFGDSLTYPEPWHIFYDGKEHEDIPSTVPPPPSDRATWFGGIVRKAFQKWCSEEPIKAENWAVHASRYCDGGKSEDWLSDWVGD